MTIYTHANAFHPDELLAIALLAKTVYAQTGLPAITRTRDVEVLRAAKADPEAYVIDVGFEFDPSIRNFDHHQGDLLDTWPDGTPFSSCGLIWRYLRQQGHLAAWGNDELLDAFEESLVKPADRFDNGVGGSWPEGEFIAAYNRPSASLSAATGFDQALRVAGELVDNRRHALTRDLAARQRVASALERGWVDDHGVLSMPDNSSTRYSYWASVLSEGKVKLIITPRSQGVWMVITTPQVPEDTFSMSTPAPEDWRGRAQFQVDSPAGPVEMEFCHKNGFLSIVRGTLEQAQALAQHIITLVHGQPVPVRSRPGMS